MADFKKQLASIDRRLLIGGGAALGLTAGFFGLRPSKNGAEATPYFNAMTGALKREKLERPTLVIDRAALDRNIDLLKADLSPGMGYRIVAKSLPALGLVKRIMERAGTDKLMVFHQPFLNYVAANVPGAKVLLGKPMPVVAAARFYDHAAPGSFDPALQVEWLIDTPQRLAQYADLAKALGVAMRLNIEIDVGLHRGGVRDKATLKTMLEAIDAAPGLSFSGFMGYDPHLASIPGLLGWQEGAIENSKAIYRGFVETARAHYGEAWNRDAMTLNTAGSPTYRFHRESKIANEVAVGSALVKPTDFDIPTLEGHEPAAFISTPVLKTSERTEIPGLEFLSGLTSAWDRNSAKTAFIYGGKWLAKPVAPEGLQLNSLFGRSTNQEMLNHSDHISLKPGDHVTFRPTQSEFVFLQFGDIAVYDPAEERIVESWPVFQQGA